MDSHIEYKDEITQKLRQLIGQHISIAQETDRAAANTCTLSFQSITYPERHVWIDTNLNGIAIDLEDWHNETEWDNAVAHFTVDSIQAAFSIVKHWLLGGKPASLESIEQSPPFVV
jgi:hypothetical protein